MPQLPPFNVVDLFCGAGGTSSGIVKAVTERLHRRINLIAVNHWQTAINTHSLNHPFVTHLCESVENVHPLDLIKSGSLDLLAASCECRFHSNARGGGPCKEQSRSQAWQLIRWATDIHVQNILMENVQEFQNWGPLLTKPLRYQGRYFKTDRPDPRHKGESFRAFICALRSLGYTVDWRVQTASDFGDPTSRKRLILQARKGAHVYWPTPTHGPGCPKPWRTARECIDWSIKGVNLFEREALGLPPLCKNTIDRISAGLVKFGGPSAEPFLVMLRGTSSDQIAHHSARSVDKPLPSITAGGRHVVLVEPFITHITHQGEHSRRCHSIDRPLPTITCARRGEMALVEPFIINYHENHAGQNDGESGTISLDEPLPTQDTSNRYALVEPLILKYYKTGRCKPLSAPLDTVTTKARFMLVEFEGGTAEIGIRTRMLQAPELAAAHSFPDTYHFTGTKEDQITQIGNSVPVELAAAHAAAILS